MGKKITINKKCNTTTTIIKVKKNGKKRFQIKTISDAEIRIKNEIKKKKKRR